MAYKKDPSEKCSILITTRCNSKCPDCAYEGILKKKNQQLSKDIIKKNILPHFSEFHSIRVLGGEPTLHPDFFEIIKLIASKNPRNIQIFSNGRIITRSEKTAITFLNKLNEATKNSKAKIIIKLPVGDPYAVRMRGKHLEAKQRVENLKRALARVSGKAEVWFNAITLPGQNLKQIVEKYGLPNNRLNEVKWQVGAAKTFGNKKKIFITPQGDVFGKEAGMVRNQDRLGNVHHEPLKKIIKRHF